MADLGRDTGDAQRSTPDTDFPGDETDANTSTRDSGADRQRCHEHENTLECSHQTETLLTGYTDLAPRDVHWQVPLGSPTEDGWPVAILFQGAFSSAQLNWEATPEDVYGRFHQVRTIEKLLQSGFAVLTPEALAGGSTYWQTNVPPYATAWETSADHQLMLDIFAAIEAGAFGPIDDEQMYAAGFSSGGYMTSRMAVAYTDRFEALAINSGSYAWCSSSACTVPDELPSTHPPTLFLHGARDATVPIWTMRDYRDELQEQQIPTRTVVEEKTGHKWLKATPSAVVEWFER
jgi:dienelactone hydrolase